MPRCADRVRARLLGTAVAAALALAGCATVPTTGPVQQHTPSGNGVDAGVRIDPLPPSVGASQLLVVEGFLHAMSVYQPDYAVAREYLTDAASNDWDPRAGVQIYADGFPPTEYEQIVALPAPVSGTLDASGRYSPASGDPGTGYAPGKNNVHNFTLIKNDDGQWRITNPPEGLLVSRYVFTTGFVEVNLHFPDPTGSALVPDPRFFAAGEQSVVRAVQAQLDGPSDWLAPAVARVDTEGITLLGVEVDPTGIAKVTLGGTAGELSAEDRGMLLAGLAYTLAGLDQVSAVQVVAGGETWRSPAGQTVVRPDQFRELAPEGNTSRSLLVVQDQEVRRLANTADWDELTRIEVPFSRPGQVAASAGLATWAATSADGTRLQVAAAGDDAARTLREGRGLLRPSFSRSGELWSPAAAGLDALQVFDGTRRVRVSVEQPDRPARLDRLPVVALAVSPDGARVAMILRQSGSTVVGLARVERGADGTIVLAGWRTIDVASTTGTAGRALDVGWEAETELLVLQDTDTGTGGTRTSSVIRVSEDGATATDIGPNEAVQLSQLAVAPNRAVALGSGGVYRLDGEFNWNLAITAVDAVAYSG